MELLDPLKPVMLPEKTVIRPPQKRLDQTFIQRPKSLLVPQSAFAARSVLVREVGKVIPGATVASPRVLDAAGTRVSLTGLLITPSFQEEERAMQYFFILNGDDIEVMKPMQEAMTLMPYPQIAKYAK